MTRLLIVAATLAGLLSALPAAAQFRKPEDAIKYRQSAMALQNNHLGRVFAIAQGRVPFDAKVAAEQIEIVAMLNRHLGVEGHPALHHGAQTTHVIALQRHRALPVLDGMLRPLELGRSGQGA